MTSMARFFEDLLREARALSPRDAWREILRGFKENDVLTYASAISFRIVMAMIPLTLCVLVLLGLFGFDEVWRNELAPEIQKGTSAAAFKVIDQTVLQVLTHNQLFWATAGALLALWEMSSGMRAVMGALARIYGSDTDDRPFRQRLVLSLWLSLLVAAMLLGALATARVLPGVLGGGALAGVAGWIVALGLLLGVIFVIVRFAPEARRPAHWVSFGAVLVTIGWAVASLLYGWYVTSVADYTSIFGSLAVIWISLGYIYLSSIVFLTGLQLEALIQREVDRREQPPEVLVAHSRAEALALAGPSAEHELGGRA